MNRTNNMNHIYIYISILLDKIYINDNNNNNNSSDNNSSDNSSSNNNRSNNIYAFNYVYCIPV